MAKSHSNRFGRYAPLQGSGEIALSTLATATGIVDPLTFGENTLSDNYFVNSVQVGVGVTGFTDGEGPLLIGIAHADYSLAEIEQWVEQTAAYTRANLIGREIANRLIRKIGIVTLAAGSAVRRSKKMKLNWQLHAGNSGLQLWVYNLDTNTLTTGCVVDHATTFNGRWN